MNIFYSPARQKALAAILIDRGLKPWEIARLTPRQKFELYAHHRDKEGRIKVPSVSEEPSERPATLESELVAVDQLQAILEESRVLGSGQEGVMTREQLDALRDGLRKKYGG